MNNIDPRQLVPSFEHCKRLDPKEWNTLYVWISENLLVHRDDELLEGGLGGGPAAIYPAPTAEELLKVFYRLPAVKAPELHYDANISKWQVWWENRKTNYIEFF